MCQKMECAIFDGKELILSGNNQEEESDSSESESCDEETDGTILNVKNIADTVLFISFYHDLIKN